MAKPKKSAWLIIQYKKEVLLLKRGPKANNPGLWNFPGGNMDEGETAPQSATREAFEESGVKIKPKDVKFLTAVQVKDRYLAFYRVKLDKKPKVTIDFESADYGWFPLKKFPKKLHNATKIFTKINKTYL